MGDQAVPKSCDGPEILLFTAQRGKNTKKFGNMSSGPVCVEADVLCAAGRNVQLLWRVMGAEHQNHTHLPADPATLRL